MISATNLDPVFLHQRARCLWTLFVFERQFNPNIQIALISKISNLGNKLRCAIKHIKSSILSFAECAILMFFICNGLLITAVTYYGFKWIDKNVLKRFSTWRSDYMERLFQQTLEYARRLEDDHRPVNPFAIPSFRRIVTLSIVHFWIMIWLGSYLFRNVMRTYEDLKHVFKLFSTTKS